MFEESTSFIPSVWASMNSWFTPTVLFVLLNLMIGTIAITSRQGNQQRQQQHQQQEEAQDQGYPQLARSPSVLQRLKSINFSNYYRSPQPTTTTAFDQTPESNTHYTRRHTHQREQEEQHQLTRSPSLLHRLRSINFYNYLSPDSNFSQSQTTTLHKTQDSDTHYTFEQHQQQEELEESDELSQDEEEEEEEEEEQEERSLDEIYMHLKGANVYTSKSDATSTSGEVPTKPTRKIKKSMSVKLASFHYEEEEDINNIESRRPATVREGKVSVTEDEEVDAKADDFINKFKQQLKLQRLDSLINWSGK
nr:probable basic-leucine zipper transcription factor Q [Quercus suber]POE66283.1 hypothetical protein CFP56_55603 [Quercus suber]